MTSSFSSLRPHTGTKYGSMSECGLRRSQLFRQHNRLAGYNKGTQVIRSVASDFTKPINHIKVNNQESSTNRLRTSTIGPVDAPASPVDLTLLHPHLRTHDAHKEVPIDVLGRGRLVENKLVYRQIFVIRSYEVGFDKTTSIETIFNLFQETSLNHAGMLNFMGDGMGTTHAMMRNRLIWVVTRMHIEMTHYPVWGDMVQIDSWVSSSGKHGMRRDFLVQDFSTGLTLGWATSNWAMMNQDTRKLSKMPEGVRGEIAAQFLDRCVMNSDKEALTRIPLLDDSVPFKSTGLAPKLSDLDMNRHVNHVKYINWVMEVLGIMNFCISGTTYPAMCGWGTRAQHLAGYASVPRSVMMSCELSKVTMEYRRECGSSDTLESLARLDMTSNLDNGVLRPNKDRPLGFIHQLRLCGSGVEVLRGRTQWRSK